MALGTVENYSRSYGGREQEASEVIVGTILHVVVLPIYT